MVILPKRHQIADDSELEELGMDSLKMVELLVAIEEQYNFRVRGEDLVPESFANPGAVLQLVEKSAG